MHLIASLENELKMPDQNEPALSHVDTKSTLKEGTCQKLAASTPNLYSAFEAADLTRKMSFSKVDSVSDDGGELRSSSSESDLAFYEVDAEYVPDVPDPNAVQQTTPR